MEIELIPYTFPRGIVTIDFLRLRYFLEEPELQSPKLHTAEDGETAVFSLKNAINSAFDEMLLKSDPQATTLLKHILLPIKENNQIRNRWRQPQTSPT